MSAPIAEYTLEALTTKGLGGKEPNMLIIGCDYHPGFQQIACVDTDGGELSERRLAHREQAEQFYRELKQQSLGARVGMESSGHSPWFERLLHELGFELWIGDPAEIRTKRVRKQKTDRQDAQLLLRLMLENRFPRIWVPDAENRDLRQLFVASASTGADAHASDESAACRAIERRPATQESVVAAGGSQGTGIHRTGSLGQPTTPGPPRLARSTHAEDPGTNACAGRGSGEASSNATADDTSRSGAADGTGLRVGDRNSRALPLRQATRQLCRTGTGGEVQRRSAPVGTHQQARQRTAALPAGRSGPAHGAQSGGGAQQFFPSGHGAGTEERESSEGGEVARASVLVVASGLRLRPDAKARF